MSLLLAHPELPTCEDCHKWLYRLPTWERIEKGGEPVRRDLGEATPCGKCPKGKPDRRPHPERELSERNWLAYQHYLEARAVGQFPDDPIVRRNAALIRAVEDSVAQALGGGMLGFLGALAGKR